MKNVILNGVSTQYYITEDGKLYNKKTDTWYKGTVSGGYLRYDLTVNGKRYSKQAHRLVAEAYLPNEDNSLVVNHIDGNKLNNSVNNLEWITQSENQKHAYKLGLKPKTNGVSSRIQDASSDNSKWKRYKDTVYGVSKEGMVKNFNTNNILKGKITKDGYIEYCLTINSKKQSILGHRLVYFTYFGDLNPEMVINHKDGNKQNNNIDNLEQISRSENVNHAYYEIKTCHLKQVAKMDLQGNVLDIYPSCAEAARQNPGCYPNLISNVCNGKTFTHHGFKWKYVEQNQE